jgi:hypothetical protein
MSWGYTLGNQVRTQVLIYLRCYIYGNFRLMSLHFFLFLFEQTEFIARLVKGIYEHRLTSIAPKPEVAELYNQTLQNRLEKTVLTSKLCTAWYRYRGTGRVIAPSGISASKFKQSEEVTIQFKSLTMPSLCVAPGLIFA